ncbi:MAG: hypothetical protein Q4D38_09865 [Planctomycetia bacterium]|nr:hypothetical protein [Planctomycetia bacterium]
MKNNTKIDVCQLDRDKFSSFEHSLKGLQKPAATIPDSSSSTHRFVPGENGKIACKIPKNPTQFQPVPLTKKLLLLERSLCSLGAENEAQFWMKSRGILPDSPLQEQG